MSDRTPKPTSKAPEPEADKQSEIVNRACDILRQRPHFFDQCGPRLPFHGEGSS